jgi:hypothetical protein
VFHFVLFCFIVFHFVSDNVYVSLLHVMLMLMLMLMLIYIMSCDGQIFTYFHTYRGVLRRTLPTASGGQQQQQQQHHTQQQQQQQQQQQEEVMLASFFLGPADAYGGDYGLYKTILPVTTTSTTTSISTSTSTAPAGQDKGSKEGVMGGGSGSEAGGEEKEELDVAHDPSKSHSVGM